MGCDGGVQGEVGLALLGRPGLKYQHLDLSNLVALLNINFIKISILIDAARYVHYHLFFLDMNCIGFQESI